MIPSKTSKAEKAYMDGLNSAKLGKLKSDNPYKIYRVIGLKNWWDIGYDQLKDGEK